MKKPYAAILADYINPLSDGTGEYVRRGAVIIKQNKNNAKIFWKGKWGRKTLSELGLNPNQVEIFDRSEYLIIPAFVDNHFHWVQDDVRLMPKDNLLSWLQKYTWPYEKKFQSKRFAKQRAEQFSRELFRSGTLSGAVYASLHSHSVDLAIEKFKGDFVVGQVLMTMNSPKGLIKRVQTSKDDCLYLSKKYRERYAFTPRFAPTTHPELMKMGRKLSTDSRCFIQTHLSETPQEIDYVLGLFKKMNGFEDVESYTEIYDRCGLLTPKTILGHGIYLSPEEWKILAKRRSSIAHCPTSNDEVKNLGLGSGLFDFKQANKYGVPWSLASDIGGGPYLSMIDVMRSFLDQNRKSGHKVSAMTALYRATKAGAKILRQEKLVGSLDVGQIASFLLIKSPTEASGNKRLEEIIFRYQSNRSQYDKMIDEVWFKGVPSSFP